MTQQEPVLECRSIWLKYRINKEYQKSFKGSLVSMLKGKKNVEEFWGLQDISFTVNEGDTLGIIGPNGSGKSSLVKVLSGIFRPDKGTVKIRGKVAALLEIGAGFQRELSGRENIYLNASILGLGRSEIKEKFNQIVNFAGLSEFIDTPIRHYSSGMYARLGFAVAVHMNPDFLIIDEVLSVGDQLFQKKCYEKINEFKSNNKTIILISHSVSAIMELCNRCLWIDSGKIIMDDSTQQVINAYTRHNFQKQASRYKNESETRQSTHLRDSEDRLVEIKDVQLFDSSGKRTHTIRTGDRISVEIGYNVYEKISNPVFGIAFQKRDGTLIAGPNTKFDGMQIHTLDSSGNVTYSIPSFPLLPGTYVISVSIYDGNMQFAYDYLDKIYPFQVVQGCTEQKFGMIYINGTWRVSNG